MIKNKESQIVLKEQKKSDDIDRRKFLKKAGYAAPKLILLGALVAPQKSSAGFDGPPPSDVG